MGSILSMDEIKPCYIHDQAVSVLICSDSKQRRKCLDPQLLRQLRNTNNFHAEPTLHSSQSGEVLKADELEKFWYEIPDREQILSDHLTAMEAPSGRDAQGNNPAIKTRRLCIVADAGMGKSKLLEWLLYRFNTQPQSDHKPLALELSLRDFHEIWQTERKQVDYPPFASILLKHLANQFVNQSASFKNQEALAKSAMEILLERKANAGRLVLLADGLDQIADHSDLLLEFKNPEDPLIGKIRLVVAGRSNAVLMAWETVFHSNEWTFLRVDPFTPEQQERYLGFLPSGAPGEEPISRYGLVKDKAPDLLFIPRVLECLLEFNTKSEFDQLETASDIYAAAIDRMIEKGLAGITDPKPTSAMVLELLARQAFYCFRTLAMPEPTFRTDYPSTAENDPPRYQHDLPDTQFDSVKDVIRKGCRSSLEENFDLAWEAIPRLNTILKYGIYDAPSTSNNYGSFVWSNKSLHEFLLALYFAKYASQEESQYLWDWIYLPDRFATDQYYPFWSYLCEMPRNKCEPMIWLCSIEMIFQPARRLPAEPGNRLVPNFLSAAIQRLRDLLNPDSRWIAKRSNEMIYRAWRRLDEFASLVQPDVSRTANRIRDRWWGEFEDVRNKRVRGWKVSTLAMAITKHFLEIPGGKVNLGTTKERREWPELIKFGKKDLLDFQTDAANLTKHFDRYSFYRTRAGRVLRAKRTLLFQQWAQEPESDASISAYLAERYGYIFGEPQEMPLSAFLLGRQTISNGWYQLYDSRHPNKHSNYSQYSPSPDHPAVALSFYDAWVYSQWLRWDGQSCRLPFEAEWEYAAKIGYPHWALEYWWEDAQDLGNPKYDFSADWIICRETRQNKDSKGMTEIPSAKRASPGSKKADPSGEGLKDMHGNTWEWCMDAWQPNSIGHPPETTVNPHPGNASVDRVMRGGSFVSNGRQASASCRFHGDPTVTSINYGLRLARAPDRKS
jgi:formylglycine-generating enzyme required for sulfatase activity